MASQVDWIIDLVAGLESPPLSLLTSFNQLPFQQATPILSFKNRIFFTTELYVLDNTLSNTLRAGIVLF